MPEEPASAETWTGLTEELTLPGLPTPDQRARADKRGALIFCGLMLCAAAVFAFFNSYHLKQITEPGEVSWVRFTPAHHGPKHWEEDQWDVHVSLKEEDGDIILGKAPPDWLTLHKPLTVTYEHGRLFPGMVITDVKPGRN